jgi:hypothetical protein
MVLENVGKAPMSGKRKIQRRLVEGATMGLRSGKLFEFVLEKVPDAPLKKIVHTAFLTLTDPDVTDRKALDAIYDLAIVYRTGVDELPQALKRKKVKSAGPAAGDPKGA